MSGTPVRIGAIPLPTNARIDGRLNAQKGQPEGIAPLDGESVVPDSNLPARLGEAALSATIEGAIQGAGMPRELEDVLAILDMRQVRPVVIAAAGDSTTSPYATGAFERAFKACAAALWPERPFSLYRWSKENSVYGAEVIWQSAATVTDPGGTDTNVPVLSDSFAGDGVEVIGRQPDIGGSAYSGTSGAFLMRNGELVSNPAYTAGGIPFVLASALATRTGKVFHLVGQMRISTQESGSRQRRLRMNLGGTTELRLQVIGATSATTCDIVKIINGTATSLGTFTGAIPANTAAAWYDVDIELKSDGAGAFTLTAKLNGVTVSATLSAAEVDAMGSQFGLADQSLNGGLRGKSGAPFLVSGDVTRPPVEGGPSPFPKAVVYNASVAGSTLDWQIQHMQAMFPQQPDVVFIHHGHNYWGDGLTDEQFVERYDQFLALLWQLWEPCPVIVSSQNPEFAPKAAAQITEHLSHMAALRAAARKRGWGYVPILEAFAARSDGGKALVQPDGIHPIIGSGTNLQTSTLQGWITERSARPSS